MNERVTRQIPEAFKKPGFYYAVTPDGVEVPVIDISNPAFVTRMSGEELNRIQNASMRQWQRSRFTPHFIVRMLARRSILVRGTLQAAGGYLSGMSSYFQKMGPDILGEAYCSRLDRKLANFIGPVCMRLRFVTMAQYLADAVRNVSAEINGRPLRLINIGGGPAVDSLNALILLNKEQRQLLQGRKIRISVLDTDDEGPTFGCSCLAALSQTGGPLEGIDIDFEHIPYDWSKAARLREVLIEWMTVNEPVVVSSEGGLFEYGTDEDVQTNLDVLSEYTNKTCSVVGSFFRDEELNQMVKKMGRLTIQTRNLESFSNLVQQAGWQVQRFEAENPMSCVVVLTKK